MSNYILCDGVLLFSSKQCVISLAFCDIWNNEVLGKCYQPQPSARLVTPRPLIIPDITKSHSIGVHKRNDRTERDTQGVGRDILIPKKLFLELCGPRGNKFR